MPAWAIYNTKRKGQPRRVGPTIKTTEKNKTLL